MKCNDEDLVLQVKNGNRRAFDRFYKSEFKKALFYTFQYMKNMEIAQDIVQDSFVALWENREQLDSKYPLQPYLYSILRNRSINALKRLTLDKRVMSDLARREFKANLDALSHDSSDSLVKRQLEEHITKAFFELPEKISSTFTDSRIKGMTYQEIAFEKGVSVKVIEYHITQALKHFRIKLKEFLE
ncbi:MAG: RNA polymerase sigma-70 factor [Bacteroidales bacterium]